MNWKDVLATVAPTVATMLGGPLAGMAVKALSAKLLGRDDGTEEEVAMAVQGLGPQDIIRLREIESDLVKTLADNEIKLEALTTQDRDSARRRAVDMRDFTPNFLAFVILGVFGWMLSRMMGGASLGPDAQVAYMMLGTLTTAVGQALAYFYGTTKGSNDKNKTISEITKTK